MKCLTVIAVIVLTGCAGGTLQTGRLQSNETTEKIIQRNNWTVTGEQVGKALKERDQILWKQQLDAGLIDKDEYKWLLENQK